MSQPPTASFINPSSNLNGAQYNGKIIIASLAMLCFVVLFILALHIYAKWFWRRSARRQQALLRRRQALHFHGQDPICVGLDKAIVDSLPTFIYKVSQVFPHEGAMECAVCLSEFQENEKGRLLPKCNHNFHTDCIDMWFLSHTTCPLCRTSADPGESRLSSDVGANVEELELSVSMLSEVSNRLATGAYRINADQDANDHVVFEPSMAEGADGESLPSPGWRWRRSTSDRFVQNVHPGVQFPTNVLFWGNNSHVSSHTNALQQAPLPRLEHGQRGARSLPPMSIEVPRRSMQNVIVPRCASSGVAQAYDEQAMQSQVKATPSGLNVFKRLLSRERKVFPTEQEMSVCGHGIGMSSGAMSSGS